MSSPADVAPLHRSSVKRPFGFIKIDRHQIARDAKAILTLANFVSGVVGVPTENLGRDDPISDRHSFSFSRRLVHVNALDLFGRCIKWRRVKF